MPAFRIAQTHCCQTGVKPIFLAIFMHDRRFFNFPDPQRSAVYQMTCSLAEEVPFSIGSPHRHCLDADRIDVLHGRLPLPGAASSASRR